MIHSIYESFIQSAKICPKNAKMILRHSIRAEIPPNQMGTDILLTREGEVMAEHFGRFCRFNLECIHTSNIQRCVQTAELLTKGYMRETQKKLEILPTSILADSYICDYPLAHELFTTYSPYSIIARFLRNEKLQGMRSLHETMDILFKYIFQNKDCENMEIFVTHDTFLIALVCFCHQIKPKTDNFIWPYMLEGAFFYHDKNGIHCIFRGEEKILDFEF